MKHKEEQGWRRKGAEEYVPVHEDFGDASQRKQAKPACSAPQLWAENPWHIQGLRLEKGGYRIEENPSVSSNLLAFGDRGISQGCNTVTIQELKQRQGNRENIRDQGCWRRRRRLKSDAARLQYRELSWESSPWAGMTRHPCTSRERINTIATTHEYGLFFFLHGIKTFCDSLI